MQRPLPGAQVTQSVDGQVEQLADAHAGVSEQKQGVGQQIVLGTQLLLTGAADGQTLLKDSLPISIRDQIDVSKITEGIDVYGKPGSSLSDLDKIADRINAQVPGVKATKPSVIVNSFLRPSRSVSQPKKSAPMTAPAR